MMKDIKTKIQNLIKTMVNRFLTNLNTIGRVLRRFYRLTDYHIKSFIYHLIVQNIWEYHEYRGVEYKVLFNPMVGNLLAYVKLPRKHPFIEILKKGNLSDIPVDCHWGLTFDCHATPFNQFWQDFSYGWWIGWDYGHASDMMFISPSLVTMPGQKIHTMLEVVDDAQKVIDQVLDHTNG